MADQSFNYRRPYGNDFLVSTPALDRYAQNVYIDQRNRELRQEQEQKQLDDEFARNVAGIRDADVGDLTKAYGDYKLAYKNLLKRPQGGTPQEQLDVLRKKADVYKVINESKQQRAVEDEVRKGLSKNADAYEDEAHNVLFNSIRTPLSQMPDELRNHDYSYKGDDTDWTTRLQKAAGKVAPKYNKTVLDDKGYQMTVTPYSYGNTPLEFRDALLSGMSTVTNKHEHPARSAAALIANIPQQNLEDIDRQYQAIPKERWQQMGVDQPQQMSIYSARTPQEQFATHQAQLYALNNLPQEGKPTIKNTPELQLELQRRRLATQEDIAAKSRGLRSWLHSQPTYKDLKSGDENVNAAGSVLSEVKDILLKPKDIHASDADEHGNTSLSFEINDPTVLKDFKGQSKKTNDEPSSFGYDFKTNKLYAIWKDKNGEEADRQEIDPKTYLKAKVRQSFPNKDIGFINNIVTQYYDSHGGNLYKVVKSLDKVPQQTNIPSGTREQWKASGWTDDLIDKGVKDGKIKVTQ